MFPLFYLANRLGSDGAKYIADVLKMNTTLESLDIGCESFFCLFGRFFGKSNYLFFCFSFSVNEVGDAGVFNIAEALKVNSTLNAISCWGELMVFCCQFICFNQIHFLFSKINRKFHWIRWRCTDCRSFESERNIDCAYSWK